MTTKALGKYLKEALLTRSLEEHALRPQARKRKANGLLLPKALNQRMSTLREKKKMLTTQRQILSQDAVEVRLLPNQLKSPETTALYQTMKT